MKAYLSSSRQFAALLVPVAALLGTSLAFAAKPASTPGNGPKIGVTAYSAQAVAFKVDGVQHPTAGPIVICDTGALPGSGGFLDVYATDVNIQGGALTIDAVEAHASGSGPEAAADTSLTKYKAHFITSDGENVYIEADYIAASASASIGRNGKASTEASVTVQGLKVNGRPIAVSGRQNEVIDLPEFEVRLVLNEQVSSVDGGSGDIQVAAIHFEICECIEGNLGWLAAGISSNGTPPPPEDEHDCGKLTGGGWITGTPSGEKGTFGLSGGVRRGEFWGHLTYIDHGANLKVESSAVTGWSVDPQDANGRIITYAVTINGVAGTAKVRAVDNGEPGRNDIFDITLSTGYHAAGDLGGARPGGGNIQLHKCPPGWE